MDNGRHDMENMFVKSYPKFGNQKNLQPDWFQLSFVQKDFDYLKLLITRDLLKRFSFKVFTILPIDFAIQNTKNFMN